jgi:hypothetical protein
MVVIGVGGWRWNDAWVAWVRWSCEKRWGKSVWPAVKMKGKRGKG